MLLNCGVGEDSWESLGLQGDPTNPSYGNQSWIFIGRTDVTLATWCEELTHWKRPWCWERLKTGGEGANKGWDGWMASPTLRTWVWASSGNWWWTGKSGVLKSLGSQRVRHNWVTELTDVPWTWTWANFARWWGREMPGVLQSIGSQRVWHILVTKQLWCCRHCAGHRTQQRGSTQPLPSCNLAA